MNKNKGSNKVITKVLGGLALCAAAQTNAVTNGKDVSIPAIVRLQSVAMGGSCTGTIVGRNPVVVLTALHCIGGLKTGTVLMMPESATSDASTRSQAYMQENMSTDVIYHDAVESSDLYIVYEESVGIFEGLLDRHRATSVKLAEMQKASTDSLTLERMMKRLMIQSQMLGKMNQQIVASLQNLVMGTDVLSLHDAVYLVFENSKRIDNNANIEDLIAEKKLIPINLSKQAQGEPVMIAGYGLTELNGSKASKVLQGSMNVLRSDSREGNLVAYGLTGRDKTDEIPAGVMGSVLQGDSGGPLLSEEGVVGVNSRILGMPIPSDTAPSKGWPLGAMNRYNYIFNEFIATSSAPFQELLEKAEAEGLAVEVEIGGCGEQCKVLNLASTLSLQGDSHVEDIVYSAMPQAKASELASQH